MIGMDECHSEEASAKVEDHRLADNVKRDSAPNCARKVGLVVLFCCRAVAHTPTRSCGVPIFEFQCKYITNLLKFFFIFEAKCTDESKF